jgi:PhnB protein
VTQDQQTQLNPYIAFKDNAHQAFEFYKSVFGGELEMHTFDEYHAAQDPSEGDHIMHAMLTVSPSFAVMGADTPNSMEYKGHEGFSISLSGVNSDELRGYWAKLSGTGTVTMPLEKQMWGDDFGMCVDQFGVSWMVNIHAPEAA